MSRETHETAAEPRRTLIAGLWLSAGGEEGSSSMDEIARLATGLDLQVVARCEQRRDKPRRGTFWGKGKLEEMKKLLEEHEADVVVANVDLPAGCRRNLSKLLDARILDRTELILEVFATRAHTEEGRLQVEMARRDYHLERMLREGKALDRQGGGIGGRGPGEAAAKLARRRIHQRHVALREKLRIEGEKRSRRRERRGEDGPPQVALVGYTNAGKSSLLNALLGSPEASAADRLFETLDTTSRRLRLRDGPICVLTDTVGFIRGLPHHLVEAFEATLAEAAEADLLVEVADGASPEVEEQRRTVSRVLERIGADGLPRLLVLNKTDLLDGETRTALGARWPDGVFVSARNGEGLEKLHGKLLEALCRSARIVQLLIPHREMGLLRTLYERHPILGRRDEEGGVRIELRLDEDEAARYGRWIVPAENAETIPKRE